MRWDYASLIGILLGLAAILGGQILEGGHVASLLQITAFVIVVGGTVGATLLQHAPPVFVEGVRMLRWIFKPPSMDHHRIVADMVAWATIARKAGLLGLEPNIDELPDKFMKKGLQMLVDGAEPDYIRHTMDLEIAAWEQHRHECAKVWLAAGGYAPTIGILGAVMGLIHVMENLSNPSKLGAGIAVAFVATIYGVGFANLLFIPIANKLKAIVATQVALKEMYVEGLVAIANGENPHLVEAKLQGFVV